MKRFVLSCLILLFFSYHSNAYNVSGFALDAETGAPLPGLELELLLSPAS